MYRRWLCGEVRQLDSWNYECKVYTWAVVWDKSFRMVWMSYPLILLFWNKSYRLVHFPSEYMYRCLVWCIYVGIIVFLGQFCNLCWLCVLQVLVADSIYLHDQITSKLQPELGECSLVQHLSERWDSVNIVFNGYRFSVYDRSHLKIWQFNCYHYYHYID